ncbi:hypothetical protein AA103196_2812 [Ameyamaea chiangmaiensis NBRC 103196]|uniref:Spy/CpxP family protein refolding chaperone n=1 Tax=Ameyamaea chiangmaiensis TaxID=442969 RepID=A0A850PG41_9PROT|nr:Spy/CpxP family protein refolding chaperone [Ameyamaea chiangmaiensis]MBS4074302.1 Spy/CpxP family protein refolding chaperone [Ameyamaea chiangmaiensis]NVN41186.1 Spy/CpxP family protein refolding chaperone [Ameyamaea chiangmaiensis]GBQ71572.1 hypothetical protein AA103196_2812 [Ameyamaea chiangmaiensis NBRC 103196]
MTFRTVLAFSTPALILGGWLATLPAVAHAADTASAAPAAASARASVPAGLEEHIKKLHDDLGITQSEEATWSAFAQTMRDNATSAHAAAESANASLSQQTAADIMKSYADLATKRGQDLQTLSNAFTTLYTSFSDDQKKKADTLFRENGLRHGGPTKTDTHGKH